MNSHTPESWRVEATGGSMADRVRVVFDYADDEQIVIADCGVSGSKAAEANARLIAAAPDLLAALQSIALDPEQPDIQGIALKAIAAAKGTK